MLEHLFDLGFHVEEGLLDRGAMVFEGDTYFGDVLASVVIGEQLNLLAGPELGRLGDLFAAESVATLDDFLGFDLGEVAVDPVVDSGGRQVELVGDLGHGEVGGFLEVIQDFLTVGAMIATVVGWGGADASVVCIDHCMISCMVLLK
jgi:hypothetical protein